MGRQRKKGDHQGTAVAAEIAGVCVLTSILDLPMDYLKNGWSLYVEFGCAKHFSHSIVDVVVDGVACDRSMDKRVCGKLSEVFQNLPVRLQLESPSYVEDQCSTGEKLLSMFWLMWMQSW